MVFLPCIDQHRSSPEYSALPRFLNECYQPQVARIRPRFQLELNILRQDLSLLQSANLRKNSGSPFPYALLCITLPPLSLKSLGSLQKRSNAFHYLSDHLKNFLKISNALI
jgi:hypothetical protein